ncbi:tail fiber assembly protein [Pseudomonas sp. ZB1P45]|uniref:tail fiber assembly protein n=1 Tax=Pseudomonas frigoris TaxID=3398356 RepID=UPI0039EE6267
MNRYVLIETAYKTTYLIVIQVLDTEEAMPTTQPDGVTGSWLDVTGDTTAQVGWKAEYFFDRGWVFAEPTHEEYLILTSGRMQKRFDEAARWLMFNPLQYKVDLGLATPADEAVLLAYKQYVVAVSEVKNQPGYPSTINWPVAPW